MGRKGRKTSPDDDNPEIVKIDPDSDPSLRTLTMDLSEERFGALIQQLKTKPGLPATEVRDMLIEERRTQPSVPETPHERNKKSPPRNHCTPHILHEKSHRGKKQSAGNKTSKKNFSPAKQATQPLSSSQSHSGQYEPKSDGEQYCFECQTKGHDDKECCILHPHRAVTPACQLCRSHDHGEEECFGREHPDNTFKGKQKSTNNGNPAW